MGKLNLGARSHVIRGSIIGVRVQAPRPTGSPRTRPMIFTQTWSYPRYRLGKVGITNDTVGGDLLFIFSPHLAPEWRFLALWRLIVLGSELWIGWHVLYIMFTHRLGC